MHADESWRSHPALSLPGTLHTPQFYADTSIENNPRSNKSTFSPSTFFAIYYPNQTSGLLPDCNTCGGTIVVTQAAGQIISSIRDMPSMPDVNMVSQLSSRILPCSYMVASGVRVQRSEVCALIAATMEQSSGHL
jgi:hypothetical protein